MSPCLTIYIMSCSVFCELIFLFVIDVSFHFLHSTSLPNTLLFVKVCFYLCAYVCFIGAGSLCGQQTVRLSGLGMLGSEPGSCVRVEVHLFVCLF